MSTITATPPPKPENDRRRSQRVPHVVEAWISSPTATDPMQRKEVMSVNLSRHGVAFDAREPLPVASFHIIDVALGDQRLRTEVRILTCRKLENGQHEIGAEFC